MEKTVEILFVRHGESNGNVGVTRSDEHPDDPQLTQLGLLQAEKLASAYADLPLSAIYASALVRACQTVQPLAKAKGMEINVLRELMEVGTEIPNTPPERCRHLAPQAYPSILTIDGTPPLFPPEDGSSVICEARAKFALDTVFSRCSDGDTVMICTHGGFIGYLLRYCLDLHLPEHFNWQIDNCAVFRIRLSPDRIPKLIRANDISHLV